MQHFLKPASGAARAEVAPPKLLEELLLAAAYGAVAAPDACLAQGTPGDASTCAQKEWKSSRFFVLRAMVASLLEGALI